MKTNEVKDLHQKSIGELKKMLERLTKELVEVRLRLKTGKLKNVHELKSKRSDLARVKTVITEKKLAGKG
jgi:large subunit ribosomal protein L29